MSIYQQANELIPYGSPVERKISALSLRTFIIWTSLWWGGVGVMAALFFVGVLDFTSSTKLSLYGISIWLNGWLLALWKNGHADGDKLSVYHDCLVIWMLSYAVTNIMWEIPWVIFSPFVFDNLHTLDDVVAQTGYMRESILHMYWWVLASFASVDLRTVNHDPTFFTIELYAFINVASTFYFFHLNSKRSPMRYLVPLLGSGAPAAATFVFSFAEVFANFENMPGGVADTLLALVWTQYQYLIFPLIFGLISYKLLLNDWQHCYIKPEKTVEL